MVPAFGHGIGIESSPFIKQDGREIRVTVESLSLENSESNKKFFQIYAYDRTNTITIENINFDIKLYNKDQLLLNELFYDDDGILNLEVNTDESGIFTFNTTINSQDEFGILSNLEFENQVSVPEVSYHVQTINQIPTDFRTKSYYDSIERFLYNPIEQTVMILVPFDWNAKNISHTNAVHIEIMFPKNFIEFLAPNYFGTANDIKLFKSSIFIDDYSDEENRIVHFILLKDHLRYIKTQMNNIDMEIPNTVELILKRGEEIKFPISALTLSEEYQVDLTWVPKEIIPDEKTKFIYTFRDTYTGAPIRDSDYTFTLLQNNKELFSRSTNAKIGADYSDYTFSKQETGLTIARFSNISGSGQETEFAFFVKDIVEQSNEISIPAWVKDNARWWAAGEFDDNTFANGIEYMIKVGIIVIPIAESDVEKQDAVIPDWVKNNAEWWSNGDIPDSAFANAIQYLIKEGIISVS